MKTRLLILSLIILVTLPVQDSFACECLNKDYSDFVENANLVFIGTVNNIVDGENYEHREKLITFDVHSIAKGELASNQVITQSNWSSCSVDYKIGTTYSVVILDVKTMSTSMCSTIPLEFIGEFDDIPNSVILAMNEPEVPDLKNYGKPTLNEKFTDEQICEIGDVLVDGVCLTPEPEEDICGRGTILVDGKCAPDYSVEKVKTVGDDAPFFGIFVYLDDLISWIFGK